jgi:hypothetical protein
MHPRMAIRPLILADMAFAIDEQLCSPHERS